MSTSPDIGCPIPERAPASHRVHAPSAMGGDLHRFWSLTFMLARTEFKLRFFGSVLGYLWTLMRPLMLFGVMCSFHQGPPRQQGQSPGPTTPRTCSGRSSCSPSSRKPPPARCAASSAARTCCARCASHGWSFRSRWCSSPVQPRHEPGRRVHLHPRRGVRADAELARADPLIIAARDLRLGRRRCCCRRCTCAFATSSRSGKSFSQLLYYGSPGSSRSRRCKENLRPHVLHIFMLNPLGAILTAVAPGAAHAATPSAGAGARRSWAAC